MMQEKDYTEWLEQGKKYQEKGWGWLGIGVICFFLFFALVHYIGQAPMWVAIAFGMVPFIFCWIAYQEYREKWKLCQAKYFHQVPFIYISKRNVLVQSIEFMPEYIIVECINRHRKRECLTIPSECVHVHPSEDGEDYIKTCSEINNFTKEVTWIAVDLYLSTEMQNDMLALL